MLEHYSRKILVQEKSVYIITVMHGYKTTGCNTEEMVALVIMELLPLGA